MRLTWMPNRGLGRMLQTLQTLRTWRVWQWLPSLPILHARQALQVLSALPALPISILILALCLGAAGCTGLPLASGESVPVPARAYRADLDLSGRLSLGYQQDGKEQALHGSFEWHQRGTQLVLTLRSPLGQTLAQIEVQDGLARLTESGGRVQTAANVDDLVQQALGWPLPVAKLQWWLQGHGQQADGQPFQATPAFNQVRTPDGWQLHFVTWHADGSPKRIDLTRVAAAVGEVTLKLIINDSTVE